MKTRPKIFVSKGVLKRKKSTFSFLILLGLALSIHAQTPPKFSPPPLPSELQENLRFAPGLSGDDMLDRIRLEDDSIDQVLQYVEAVTGKLVLKQESLPSPQLNFDSEGPISRADAAQALETILTLNGVSITSLGPKFIKAVPTASIRYQSPEIITGSVLVLPPSQKHYTKIFDIKHLAMEEVSQIVNSLQTPGLSTQLVLRKANAVMVTDSLTNLQQMERILRRTDVVAKMDSQMIFRSLNYISSEELKQRLETMAQGPLKRFLDGDTFFESDERTNQIIIITNPTNVGVIEDVVDSLDVDAAPLTKTEVFYLKHAKSEEVASLLNSLVSGQTSATRRVSTGSVNRAQRPAQPDTDARTTVSSVVDGQDGSNDQFSSFITIEPDERSNAIIVFGTGSDIRYISDLIKKVDIILAQVKIDVIITEVTIGDKYNRGIDSFGVNIDESDEITVGINQLVDSAGDFLSAVADMPVRIGATLEEFTLNTVFQTAASDSDVTILSSPTLMTTHNKEAEIKAVEKRPVITGSSTDTTGSSIRSEVQLEEIGIQLKVTPLIGSNGVVQMEIEQTIDKVNGTTIIDGNQQPIIASRSATSYVSVEDGEVIVLGGLQENESKDTRGRIFLLGQIPLLGDWLFSSKRIENTRRDLVIFIRPRVVYTSAEASALSRQLIEGNVHEAQIEGILSGEGLTTEE